MFVACAAPSEFMDLVSTCREGGACRYPRLEPLITHIVVRSPCTHSNLKSRPSHLLWEAAPSGSGRLFAEGVKGLFRKHFLTIVWGGCVQVGADRLADELACIKQHQQRHSALVRVVDAGWLRACSTLRLRVGEEAHALGPAALLPPASASARELATMQGNREASRGAWDGAC